ncbi:hypothetical protein SeMB42_g06650 [Synchytrium endobioticum]|uniref:Glycosyltransferase 2-like domain-containing protein n=1 Tax=Synchytrium endobioticum TaxID=286115 RepID=A0A507DDG5_9FUNG|nr:hypothetical protein SeMB42_g06650 [Synchytrium endobioticum]TPX48908.1 hypothetical protein SeLEV6574_g01760 [Synchytrium endobioticum]
MTASSLSHHHNQHHYLYELQHNSSSSRLSTLARRTSVKPWQERLIALPWRQILQRFPGILLIFLVAFAIFGPAYAPVLYSFYFLALHVNFLVNNFRTAYGVYIGNKLAREHSFTNWLQKYCDETGTSDGMDTRHDLPFDTIVHIIILPNYKEEMETLCETLDVLASHTRALTQYKICLAMEESESNSHQKAHTLKKLYGDFFYEIVHTIHPAGLECEIRGKSSNVAWASRQMANSSSRHEHEIVTVMDADTCFSEDYFASVTYHYCVASPEQRKIMMFAPGTIFDRNAKDVPLFVRITDIMWSIGVMSNLYPGSPIKLPCSAYSISMDLAAAINFWDAGPEAIGEDMHMYLKSFFCTQGRLIVKSIFSPASQCNIEGVGTGLLGFANHMQARYTQGKRHLWGSLDTGYSLRRILFAMVAPEADSQMIQFKNIGVDTRDKEDHTANVGLRKQVGKILTLLHRLGEAHLFIGHMVFLVIVSQLLLPGFTIQWWEDKSAFLWSHVSSAPLHPYVEASLHIGFWLRLACLIPNVAMIWYYEKYHAWVSSDRWVIQAQQMREAALNGNGMHAVRAGLLNGTSISSSSSDSNRIRVQSLGMRPSLCSLRAYPMSLLDWIGVPVSGFCFYLAPQFHAQLAQLFTDRLDYKVAAKPTLNRLSAAQVQLSSIVNMTEQLPTTPTSPSNLSPLASSPRLYRNEALVSASLDDEVKSVLSTESKGDEGYFEDLDDNASGHLSFGPDSRNGSRSLLTA